MRSIDTTIQSNNYCTRRASIYLHPVIIDESRLRQRVHGDLDGIFLLRFHVSQNESELVSPIVAHLEAGLLVLDIPDFNAFEAFVESDLRRQTCY